MESKNYNTITFGVLLFNLIADGMFLSDSMRLASFIAVAKHSVKGTNTNINKRQS